MQFSFVHLAKKNSEGDIEGQMGLMELNKKQASQDQTYADCRSNASFDRTLPPCSPTHTTNTPRKEAFSLPCFPARIKAKFKSVLHKKINIHSENIIIPYHSILTIQP